ncbi:MAG: substrate-binding domain-containing protein [Kiloniellaceae bacterium]
MTHHLSFGARAAMAVLALPLLGAAAAAQVAPREPVRIVGPATVFALTVAAGERFALQSGREMPISEPLGTETGLALFCAGNGAQHPDILSAERRLGRADLAACTRNGVGVSELTIGFQAVALAQNPGAPPLSPTRRQVFLALAREVPLDGRLVANPYRLWSDIDFALPVAPIEVLVPPPGSPLRQQFTELVMEPAAAEFPALRGRAAGAFRTDGAAVELAADAETLRAELARRPQALAVIGFNELALAGGGLRAVPVDGVAPTAAGLADGSYRPARPIHLYVKRAHADAVPGLKDYLAEILGAVASGPGGYLTARGLVPLAPAAAEAQRAAARSLPPL